MQASLSEADGGEASRLRRGGRRSTGNDAGPSDAAPTEQGGAGPSSGRSAGGRGRRVEQQQQHAAAGSSREAQHSADGSDAIMEAVVKVRDYTLLVFATQDLATLVVRQAALLP